MGSGNCDLFVNANANIWDKEFVTQMGLILINLNRKGCLKGTQSQIPEC